jgi:hypothetical protein
MKKSKLGEQAMVALDADEAGNRQASVLLAPIFKAVRAHGTREGRTDYEDRASDVAAGLQDSEWAWPFTGADDAYLSNVTSSEILRAIGISDLDVPKPNLDRLWGLVSGAWLEAFKSGYVAAHEAASKRPKRKSPAQLDREIAEALRYRSR